MTISIHKKRILNNMFKKYNNETFKSLVAKKYKEFKNEYPDFKEVVNDEITLTKDVNDFCGYVTNSMIGSLVDLDEYDLKVIKETLNINDLIEMLRDVDRSDCSFNVNIDDFFDDNDFKDLIEKCLYCYYIETIENVVYNRYCF